MRNNIYPIAKEGWSYIGYSALAFVLFFILDLDILEFLSFVAILFFIFMFRNPERAILNFEENSVVSPVDGVVLSISESDEPEYEYKIEINSTYFDVCFLRVPLSSSLKSVDLKRGARLSKFNDLAKDINENVALVFEDAKQNKVKVLHMLKHSFDEIRIGANVGQNLLQSIRYGTMINGVTTLYIPKNFRLNISVGNELRASESLIGYFSN